jgi:hypothetical protein
VEIDKLGRGSTPAAFLSAGRNPLSAAIIPMGRAREFATVPLHDLRQSYKDGLLRSLGLAVVGAALQGGAQWAM